MGRPAIAGRDLAIAIGIAVLIALVLLLSGCGGDAGSGDGTSAQRPDPQGVLGSGAKTRDCDLVFDGPGPPDWRRHSAWVGRLGLAGGHHGPEFHRGAYDDDGLFRVKTPTLIEGHRPVTISIPPGARDRAGIEDVYGKRGYASVTYVPCPDKPRTVFAAGFVLRDRDPIRVLVAVGDGPERPLVVGGGSVAALRDAVIRGAMHDFHAGTEVGPASFDECLAEGLRERLTRRRLEILSTVHDRRYGGPYTVQALARLSVPIGDGCGGRQYVPELIFAAHALAHSHLEADAAERVGIQYGPYLGITCPQGNPRRPVPTNCDGVGIDVVIGRRARAVTAVVGGRRVELRTPGLHNGARGRDWVGYLERVGLERPGSPFELPGRTDGHWAGYPPLYLPVRLSVSYRDGGSAEGFLPRVFLSPGWG